MDLRAALTRLDPLEIDAIDVIDGTRQRTAGPRRAMLEDVRARYGAAQIRLVVRVEEAPDARGLDDRARDLKRRTPRGAIPVLAAPYIGPALRRRLEQAGVGWLDSIGNIHVQLDRPAILLHIEARGTRASLPRFRGRLFSPAHSRVARALLERPDDAHRLKDLAVAAETDASSVSRAMKVFLEADLVERLPNGWRVPDPAALLDSWLDHALSRPTPIRDRWFVSLEDPTNLMVQMAKTARRDGIGIAFTAIRAAALVLEKSPGHAPVEAYADPFDRVSELVELLGASDDSRSAANLRLIASPHGGAFVAVDPEAPLPVVGRMQLVTDLFRAGRDGEPIAQAIREHWTI